MYCPRPPRPRPIEPAVEWIRLRYLCRRPRHADRDAEPEEGDPCGAFHGWWRRRALYWPSWYQTCRQGRADRSGAAVDAENSSQPRRAAHRRLQWYPSGGSRGSFAVLEGPHQGVLWL